MTTLSRNSYSQDCVIDLHTSLGEGRLRLDNYLLESTQELDAITELASRGEAVDRDSRAWMLAQVDFIVETIGNESVELGDEMRSNLLQLLLAIANLNEQIRHQASLGL
jgi:flagellar biosynthesis regulator FlaF